jgi:hypothetical protein
MLRVELSCNNPWKYEISPEAQRGKLLKSLDNEARSRGLRRGFLVSMSVFQFSQPGKTSFSPPQKHSPAINQTQKRTFSFGPSASRAVMGKPKHVDSSNLPFFNENKWKSH